MAEQEQHTPGPWEVHSDFALDIYAFIAERSRREQIAFTNPAFVTREQAEANARLIAAAPDLLQAALDTIDLIEKAQPAFFEGHKPFYTHLLHIIPRADQP